MLDKNGKTLGIGDRVTVEMTVAEEDLRSSLSLRLESHEPGKASLAFNAAPHHVTKVDAPAGASEPEDGDITDDSHLLSLSLDRTATEIIEESKSLTDADTVSALIDAEKAGKGRKTVIEALDAKLTELLK